MAEQYDVIIVGAGQAGSPLATAFAGAGRNTALIEREHAGGTCINEGCTPTKTMVASGRVAYLARRAGDYGVQTGPIHVDMTKVRARKRDIVTSWHAGSERRVTGVEHLTYLRGEARFTAPKTLTVTLPDGGTREMTAETIVLNVGARPAAPPLDGLDRVPYLNSTTVMELGVVPDHLLVLGGGYIGVEFGQLFRRLGSRVTIIQHGAHLLPKEDPDVSEAVAGIFREDGSELLLQTKVTSAAPGPTNDAANSITLTVETPDGTHTISGSHLLVAVGRTPNSDSLNLAAAGITADKRGNVTVNKRLETNVPGIYAVGDMNGGPAFTHISYDDFRILRTNLIEGGHATTANRLVPQTVFMDPQLGRVGMSETDAKHAGQTYKVAKMPMSHVARASEVDETRGFMKALVDPATGQILGCAILGIEGGEMMAMVQIAMMGKLPYTTLENAVFAHPTLAESLNNLWGFLQDPE